MNKENQPKKEETLEKDFPIKTGYNHSNSYSLASLLEQIIVI